MKAASDAHNSARGDGAGNADYQIRFMLLDRANRRLMSARRRQDTGVPQAEAETQREDWWPRLVSMADSATA